MSNRKMFLIMCSFMVSSAFGADASKLHFGLAAVGAGLAVIGAGIGSVFPVVGTVIGGALGALLGAILGYFGGEKLWWRKNRTT